MSIKLQDGRYKCKWCNKVYKLKLEADNCPHDIVYMPILRSDINRLKMFILTKNDELITETMMNSLTAFLGNE